MLFKFLGQLFPFLILASMLLGARTSSALDKKMQRVHNAIVQDYRDVDHLSIEELKELESEHTAIFDVRELSEFKISHIENAIQIDPDISTKQFINTYQEQFQDKTIVFYCSVGRRSSDLANRVDEALNKKGFAEIYNLKGGLFEWHNQQLPLINTSGETEFIHPYNKKWAQLITETDKISY